MSATQWFASLHLIGIGLVIKTIGQRSIYTCYVFNRIPNEKHFQMKSGSGDSKKKRADFCSTMHPRMRECKSIEQGCGGRERERE